jgi:hypothetical protein
MSLLTIVGIALGGAVVGAAWGAAMAHMVLSNEIMSAHKNREHDRKTIAAQRSAIVSLQHRLDGLPDAV